MYPFENGKLNLLFPLLDSLHQNGIDGSVSGQHALTLGGSVGWSESACGELVQSVNSEVFSASQAS